MNTESSKIPFHKPHIGSAEEEAILAVLRSGWLTTGQETLSFEKEFAAFTGAPHTLAVNSATSGLHLVLESFGISPGDKVIMSPMTFTSSAEVVRYLGADVIFADIEPADNSWNIDPERLEIILAKTPDVKAVMPVHMGGKLCDMGRILELTRTKGIRICEDAAHAFPLRYGSQFAGTIGDAGVYSFYATKTITTGEGGMIVTSDPELSRRMSLMRLHGIDRDVWTRYSSKAGARSWEYDIIEPGFKYNMTDLAASMGRVQLKKADFLLAERKALIKHYLQELSSIDSLILPPFEEDHAWHLFVIQLKEDCWSLSRDEVMERLFEKGIGVSVHFKPLHLMSYWRERYHLKPEDFPESVKKYKRSISLPLWPGLSDGNFDRIITVIKELSRRYRR